MAKELLDEADVGSALQHVLRASVAQDVAASALADLGGFDRSGHPVAEVVGIEARAVAAEEKGVFAGVQDEARPALLEVASDPVQGAVAHRDEAALASLALADV